MIHNKNRSRNNNSGKVCINGKTYQTVAYRLSEFRKKYPVESGWSIATECVQANETHIVFKATIRNPEGNIISTGHSEEQRNASRINKTSALENAETSAIGRALAAAGFIGSEIASADEVTLAIEQQKKNTKKTSWENTEVPKQLLPVKERNRPIKWIDLIADKVKLQGKHKVFSGAQYLHALQNWQNPFVQSPQIQRLIQAALKMRENLKSKVAVSQAS